MGKDLDEYEDNEEKNLIEQDVLDETLNAFFKGFEESLKKSHQLFETIDSSEKGPGQRQKIFLKHLQDQLIQSFNLLNKEFEFNVKGEAELREALGYATRTLEITTTALRFMWPIIRGVNLALKDGNLMEDVLSTFPVMKTIFNQYNPIASELSEDEIKDKKKRINTLLNEDN